MSEEIKTFGAMVRAAASAYGRDIAIILRCDDGTENAISFCELEAQSAVLARGLLARGAGKGSRIGFIAGNGPQFAIQLAAIARVGAIAVPISTLIKAGELVRVLRQSDIQGLIVQRQLLGKDYVERLLAALPALRDCGAELRLQQAPYLRWIVSDGENLPASVGDKSWLTDAAESVDELLLREVEAEVHPTDQLLEIYTSGSMALPKGVKHLHGPALFRARYLARMTKRVRGDRITATMPMFWIGGLAMSLLTGWVSGGSTLCTEGTSTNSRFAMGAVLTSETIAALQNAPVFWGLGMSETFGPYSFGDELRAPGFPLCPPLDHIADRYEVRVADKNDRPVIDGETGEIQVRGYALAPALHKLDRAAHYTADGFLRTGDLAVVERRESGPRIHFIGRAGDMIKTNGSNVSPAEVELELQSLEGIESAFVFGVPDTERGQQVVAGLVAEEGATLDFDEIGLKMRDRLSSFKVPRAYVRITRQEIPMLHSNKVARRSLQELIFQRLASAQQI